MLFKNLKDLSGNNYSFCLYNNRLIFDNFEDEKIYHFGKETFVSPGWIDIHTHCNPLNNFVSSKPDEIGFKTGVCLIMDAGSVGLDNLDELFLIQKNWKTNIRSLLNISRLGIPGQYELNNLSDIKIDYDEKYQNFIMGYKARISGSVVGNNGNKPLKIFKNLRKQKVNLPLMVHLGNQPPSFVEIIDELQPGDVLTHVFSGKNDDLFCNADFTPNFTKAIEKGLKVDIGHGTSSFDSVLFKNILLRQKNFKPDFISTDIYEGNIKSGVVKNLPTTMSKMHALGMKWSDIIDCVTVNPAQHFNLTGFGTISDETKNLTFFQIHKTSKLEIDSKGQFIKLEEEVVPVAVILNGEFIEL
ncbi:dihydroorotase [Entomoplasma freundtii]|uniref:Dihydroorotase n=1 Tax=Entomoplasma freundtii TaxID=74700 RepID=A0A2K8NQP4_9MOLU|nr:hypothetical protein [Entomoplasma freundtii]ATZ16107.1 dihydroorotase [Entomoplasma freundtii]TDY56992.1 dihydroorotase [Entomoplasma freundtii]